MRSVRMYVDVGCVMVDGNTTSLPIPPTFRDRDGITWFGKNPLRSQPHLFLKGPKVSEGKEEARNREGKQRRVFRKAACCGDCLHVSCEQEQDSKRQLHRQVTPTQPHAIERPT